MINHSGVLEPRSEITSDDEARLISALDNDVGVTLGDAYAKFIRQQARSQRESVNGPNHVHVDAEDYEQRVAEYVQQEFLDSHIDTTWPTCPFHTRHPLWVHKRHWVCERLNVPVAPIGGLRATRAPDGSYRILVNEDQSPTA
jgi:hypothetical protein